MHFWNQESDYFKLQPLTKEMVFHAEKELKVCLPESFIALLEKQNGGYINFDAHPTSVPTEWADDHIKVDHIYGIAPKDGILNTSYLVRVGVTKGACADFRRWSLVDRSRLSQAKRRTACSIY